MIFIFTPKKLKRKIIFDVLRINKKFTFYCDKLSIETKKSQLHTLPHSTHFRYIHLNKYKIYFLIHVTRSARRARQREPTMKSCIAGRQCNKEKPLVFYCEDSFYAQIHSIKYSNKFLDSCHAKRQASAPARAYYEKLHCQKAMQVWKSIGYWCIHYF